MSQELMQKLNFSTLSRNSILLVLSNIGGAILSFGISILIGRNLGRIDLGNWTFIFAWVAIISLVCEFGINSLLTREASRSPEESNKLLIASLSIQILLTGIFGFVIWIFSPILSINPETLNGLRVAVLIAFAGIVYGSFTAIFRSAQWVWPILWINILGLTVQVLFSFLAIQSNGTMTQLVWIAAVVDVFQLIAALILWWIKIKPSGGEFYFSKNILMNMIKHAIPFAFAGILAAAQSRSIVMIISYLKNVSELGLFGAASRWSESAKLIPNGIFGALYPAFATKQGLEYYKRFSVVIQVLAVCITLILCLLSRPILLISYGAEYIQGAPILFWLGVGILPSLLNGTMQTYLYATGDENYATKLRGLTVCIQIAVGFPLIHYFGAMGAAVGLFVGEAVIWFPLQHKMKEIMHKAVKII